MVLVKLTWLCVLLCSLPSLLHCALRQRKTGREAHRQTFHGLSLKCGAAHCSVVTLLLFHHRGSSYYLWIRHDGNVNANVMQEGDIRVCVSVWFILPLIRPSELIASLWLEPACAFTWLLHFIRLDTAAGGSGQYCSCLSASYRSTRGKCWLHRTSVIIFENGLSLTRILHTEPKVRKKSNQTSVLLELTECVMRKIVQVEI